MVREVSNDVLPCPVCQGSTHSAVMTSASGYPIVQCNACQTVFTDDRGAPDPSELYPPFDQSEKLAAKSARRAAGLFLRQRAAVVESVRTSGRLLDFGCGNGAFAHHMSERGFEAVGLEPFSLGKPESEGRLQLIREPFDSASPKLGKFDVITMWQVLEHLHHPVELLQKLAEHLNPGGALIVSVPNYGSLQSALFKGRWFHLDPPRHLIHFDEVSLGKCLDRAGLHVVDEHRFLPEYGSSGWVQSGLNMALPHKNFLYELVKDRGALESMRPAEVAAHLAVSLVGSLPLLALSLPVEAAASLFNRSAALTVVTQRTAGAAGQERGA